MALDKLGEFVVTKLRDAAIDHADALLAGRWEARSYKLSKPTSAVSVRSSGPSFGGV